jgi:hypothetical protein
MQGLPGTRRLPGTLDSMANGASTSLIGAARAHWRSFGPVWVFPLVFLFGGLASERLGHPTLFYWVVALPLFFWAFFRATAVWRKGLLSYWHTVFWAMLVPFLIWAVAVYARLFVLHLVGTDHAV